jgi:subtilase family serine protease
VLFAILLGFGGPATAGEEITTLETRPYDPGSATAEDPVTLGSGPDLITGGISAVCMPDGTLNLFGWVQNTGNSDAPAFRFGVYISDDSTITTDDLLLATCTRSEGLLAGQGAACEGAVSLPPLEAAEYYVGIFADDQYEVAETDEGNNALSGSALVLPCLLPDIQIVPDEVCFDEGTLFVTGDTTVPPADLSGVPSPDHPARRILFWARS